MSGTSVQIRIYIRFCSKVFHLFSCIIDVTLSGLSGLYGLLLTKLTALRCTCSICFCCVFFYWGFHIGVAYSSFGRTKLWCAISLTFGGQYWRLRLRNPNTLEVLLQMLSTCRLYFKLLLSSTPRFSWWSTKLHNGALLNVEFHLQRVARVYWGVQVVLQMFKVLLTNYGSIDDTVVFE